MNRQPMVWKIIVILAVVSAAAFFGFPPSERISFGLDLRGGAHILMQVETGSAIKYQLDLTQDMIGQRLKNQELAYESILPTGKATIKVQGTDPSRRTEVRQVFTDVLSGWNISDAGAGEYRLSMPLEQQTYYEQTAIDTTLTTLRNRIDALGVAEPLVQKQGLKGDRILIQLPGVEDPERIKDILKDPARLEWKAVSYPPTASDPGNWFPPDSKENLALQFGGTIPEDTELFAQEAPNMQGVMTTIWWPLKRISVVSGGDLQNAYRDQNEWGDPVVAFQLTQDAGKRFEIATAENQGKKMAIVMGSSLVRKVISAPVIESTIRDRGVIRGGFSVTTAEDLALKLRSGAMPTDVSIIEERTVGPSLGQDSIRAGLVAGFSGFFGVLVFMLIYYRLSGVNAVVALGLNVILVFGAFYAGLAYVFMRKKDGPYGKPFQIPWVRGLTRK